MSPELETDMATERQFNKAAQKLARAIEDSYPRVLSGLVDKIGRGYSEGQKHVLHQRLLDFAKGNYNAEANGATLE